MPAPSPATRLLQAGQIHAVVGPRTWFRRAAAKLLTNHMAAFAVGAGLAGAVAMHHGGSGPGDAAAVAQQAPLVEPRAIPADASAFHATTQASAQSPIEAALAATIDRVALAPDPSTIPDLLLAENQPFMALTARLESFQPHAYFDPGGLNVGYGYCISKRLGETGAREGVRKDLAAAGFDGTDIRALLEGTRAQQEQVAVTPSQALRLLAIVQGEYIKVARQTVGTETFDALPAHRQAALGWLAYNTGAGGFPQFHNLIEAVRENRPLDAVQHITPRFRDSNGTRVVNARAGTALMASYWSDAGLRMAVEHMDALTASARKGASPLLAVDPQLKNGRHGSLPASPYLMSPGTVDITSIAARYEASSGGLALDGSQYSGKNHGVASKGFGFDDKSMAIWRAMKAKQAGAGARPKPR